MAELLNENEESGSGSESESDLNLSYASSPFKDSEADEVDDDNNVGPVLPYRFEPVESDEEENGEAEAPAPVPQAPARLGRNDWCQCGNCQAMDKEEECVCCREVAAVVQTIDEYSQQYQQQLGCIIEHPGFASVCLDIWVLRTAYRQYRQRYGELNEPIHERYRYTAYRQLVRWCWGFLGREYRVPIPSCVVTEVRRTFPSEQYTGFRYPGTD